MRQFKMNVVYTVILKVGTCTSLGDIGKILGDNEEKKCCESRWQGGIKIKGALKNKTKSNLRVFK